MLNFNGLSNEFTKELTRAASDKVIGAAELNKLKEIANSEKGNKKDQEFIEYLQSKNDQELIQFKTSGSSISSYNLRLDESDTPDISNKFRSSELFKYVEVNLVDNNSPKGAPVFGNTENNKDITDGFKRLDIKYTEHLSGLGAFDTSMFYSSRVDDFNALAKDKPFVQSYKEKGSETFAINFNNSDDLWKGFEPFPTTHNIKDNNDKVPVVSEKVANLQSFLNERLNTGKEIKVNGVFGANTIFALGNVYAKALQEGDKKTVETLKPVIDKLAGILATADGMEPGHILSYSLKELSTAGNMVSEARIAFEHAISMGQKAIESAEKGNIKEVIDFKKRMFEKSGSDETKKLLESSGAYNIIFSKLQDKLEVSTDKYILKQYIGEGGKAPMESLLTSDGKVKRPELEIAKNILKSGALSYQTESLLKKKVDEIEGLAGKEDKAKWDAQEMEFGISRSKINTLSDSGLFSKVFDDTTGIGFLNKQNPRLSVAALQVAEKAGLLYTEISKLSTEQARNLVRHVLEVDSSPAGRKLSQDILYAKPQVADPGGEFSLKQDEINKINNGPVSPPSINPVLFSQALKEALTFPANDGVAELLVKSIIYGDIDPKSAFSKLSDGDLKDLVKLTGDNLSRHMIMHSGGISNDTPDKDILLDKIKEAGRKI